VPKADLTTAGDAVHALAALVTEQGRLDAVERELDQMPAALEVHATTGPADLLVRVAAASHVGLPDLIQEIVALRGVSSNTSIALSTPLTYRVQPPLDAVTQSAAFGRSTPRVD
jgi:DNA-binding Lrp family transcriptional regulator